MVDTGAGDDEEGRFSLADVVDAAQDVYVNCVVRKGQVGLEFPGEERVFVRVVRLDGLPPGPGSGSGLVGVEGEAEGGGDEVGQGEERRVRVPGGKGVLYVGPSAPGRGRNGTAID